MHRIYFLFDMLIHHLLIYFSIDIFSIFFHFVNIFFSYI